MTLTISLSTFTLIHLVLSLIEFLLIRFSMSTESGWIDCVGFPKNRSR